MSAKGKVVKSTKNPTSKVVVRDGAIARIAYETGYSISHVTNVLAGRRCNVSIIKAARKYVKRNR